MKSIYLLIPTDKEPETSTPFFRLRIGIANRDQRNKEFLSKIVADKGWFLQIWSLDVRTFVEELASSMEMNIIQLRWKDMDINDFCKVLRKYHCVPATDFVSPERQQMIEMLMSNSSPGMLLNAGSLGRIKPKFSDFSLN